MRVLGVIPARWSSKRFEGKVLAPICGKPMLQHVWERSKIATLLDQVVIACDDQRVFSKAREFGAEAIMTSPALASGTDRIAEAVKNVDCDIIINIQGDEPLIHPAIVDSLANALIEDEACVMATVIKAIREESDIHNPNVVKVVVDDDSNALYFSRAAIPFNRDAKPFVQARYFKHLGIYGYRKNFLKVFCELPKSCLEQFEQLEQLRVLEAGYKIKAIETDRDTIGVDTPEDLIRAEKYLKEQGKFTE